MGKVVRLLGGLGCDAVDVSDSERAPDLCFDLGASTFEYIEGWMETLRQLVVAKLECCLSDVNAPNLTVDGDCSEIERKRRDQKLEQTTTNI